MDRTDILATANHLACARRNGEDVTPKEMYEAIAHLWRGYWCETVEFSAQDVAAMLLLVRVSKISLAAGSATTWAEIAEYAAYGGEIAPQDKEAKRHETDQ